MHSANIKAVQVVPSSQDVREADKLKVCGRKHVCPASHVW